MFGKKLRELRIIANMRQKDVAKLLNVSPSTIGMYEQGRRDPDTDTVIFIANYFGVTTDYLLGKDDKKQQKPPDYDTIVLTAPTLHDALRIAANLKSDHDLTTEWMYAAWAKAIEKFGVPKPVPEAEPAAHSSGVPGTGIFEEYNKMKKKKGDDE